MVCSAYFGELTESRKTRWKNDDTNPYGVLVWGDEKIWR